MNFSNHFEDVLEDSKHFLVFIREVQISVPGSKRRVYKTPECKVPRMAGLIDEKKCTATRKRTVNTMSKEILKFVSGKCINDITTIAEKQVL